jgi:hypothetical protein
LTGIPAQKALACLTRQSDMAEKRGIDLYTKGNISILVFALRAGATNNVVFRVCGTGKERGEIKQNEKRETFEKDGP